MSDTSGSPKPRPDTAAIPHYTLGEEIMNSVTHGVGFLLGIAGLVLLIVKAALGGAHPASLVAAIVYGVSIILEYLASTLYHAIQPRAAKRVFRIIDHSCIYLLIAGSYTPFCLITLENDGGIVLFVIVWVLAFAGIAFEAIMRERQPRWLTGVIYLARGVSSAAAGWLTRAARAGSARHWRRLLHHRRAVLHCQEDSLYAQRISPVGPCRQHFPVYGGDPLRDLIAPAAHCRLLFTVPTPLEV